MSTTNPMTLVRVAEAEIMERQGSSPYQGAPIRRNPSPELATLIKELKHEADEAWNLASTRSSRGDYEGAEYWRGKAHALCRVLGDQEALGMMDLL